MKPIITLLALVVHLMVFSQSNQITGNYKRTLGQENKHKIIYKLSLNQDGTFTFHSYTKNENGIPPEVNKYGKGTWKVEKNIVSFFTDEEEDINEKYSLNFNNSKARFISKSPRDKSDRIVETGLQFYKSNIFWIEHLKILKD